MLTVTYLKHSGFLVETDEHRLLFDWIGGNIPESGNDKPMFAFCSHSHGDHFDKAVFSLNCPVYLGCDIQADAGRVLQTGESDSCGTMRVQAYPSTDLGASFLVTSGNTCIFHAGDLNLWHWRDESTPAEIEEAYALYKSALSALPEDAPDIAFFPVDPRMGSGYDEGAEAYIRQFRPKYFVPMHFWSYTSAPEAFARAHAQQFPNTTILTMHEGDTLALNETAGGMQS